MGYSTYGRLHGLDTSNFVKRGYAVSPLATSGIISSIGPYSALVVLEINADVNRNKKLKNKKLDPKAFLEECKAVFRDFEGKYHSLVVYETNGSFSWAGSNLPKSEEEELTRFDKVSEDDEA